MIDIIATLLEIASELASTISGIKASWRLFVVRAFLWTTWQRCQLIYFHLATQDALVQGSFDGKKGSLALRGTSPSPGITIHEMSKQVSSIQKSSYMCGWNFELLRANPVCIGADFRRMHQLFNAEFGGHGARCLPGQSSACNGDSPRSCQRFHGMVIQDQSAHDESCSMDCMQLVWDEMSYRNISGGRAVRLLQSQFCSDRSLQYCNASDQTLAISNVWSHGQGGRPETGFNSCLHDRYARIARSLGCTSYWIDAICIPDDHQLRTDAIRNINETFMEAKVMLVCDRDIMKIDVSNLTILTCETLLVTAIVSDWNTRAWTFFEAFRARRTIHLLCKNNAIVPLRQVIQRIHHEGALDIAALTLVAPHFLPPFDDLEMAKPKSEGRQSYRAGYLPIETSGTLLSHRPASRPGDDVVIWSLLISERTIFNSAEAFWKSMQAPILEVSTKTGDIVSRGMAIRTSYLISSAPRLKTKGLGWAPASPTFHSSNHVGNLALNGFDGGASKLGWVTKDGLVSHWLYWRFEGCGLEQLSHEECPRNLARIRAQYLEGYRWGTILCPTEEDMTGDKQWRGAKQWWESGGRLRRTIVVVCGTNETNGSVLEAYTYKFNKSEKPRGRWVKNEVTGWEWKGIYLWDDVEPLPKWQMVDNLLIV